MKLNLKELDGLMALCLKRGAMQCEVSPDGTVKLAFHPMAFEPLKVPEQVPLPPEPEEPIEKPETSDTVIRALMAVEGR